jgi:hypothetical protein
MTTHKRVDDIVNLIDAGLIEADSDGPRPDPRCWRCQKVEVRDGRACDGRACDGCRAWMLGETDEDPTGRRPRRTETPNWESGDAEPDEPVVYGYWGYFRRTHAEGNE